MDRYDLLFKAEVSSRYHRRRAAFLQNCSTAANMITFLGGASAFVALVQDSPGAAKALALMLTAVGGIQIVLQLDKSAADHRFWLSRWNRLLAAMRNDQRPSASTMKQWNDEVCAIESECVNELRTLAHLCYNQAKAALGWQGQDDFKISWPRRLACHLIS